MTNTRLLGVILIMTMVFEIKLRATIFLDIFFKYPQHERVKVLDHPGPAAQKIEYDQCNKIINFNGYLWLSPHPSEDSLGLSWYWNCNYGSRRSSSRKMQMAISRLLGGILIMVSQDLLASCHLSLGL